MNVLPGPGKACEGQTVAKGICGLDAKGVKVAVTHIDPFGIILIVHIAVVVTEVPGRGIVLLSFSPGVRKLSGGVHFSCEDVGKHMSADIA